MSFQARNARRAKTHHSQTPNPKFPQGWEPYGGAPKQTVATGMSLRDARQMCAEANEGLDRKAPGQTFHEFEQE